MSQPFSHIGLCCSHVPEVLHVVDAQPSLMYPELHEKEATVSTGYVPSIGS